MQYFDDIKEALKQLTDSINAANIDLNTVRGNKAAVQAAHVDLGLERDGRYIHSDTRLILSAPEIIIGNVDANGVLMTGDSHSAIILRGNDISLEGSSATGKIQNRAPIIENIAVDPGIDGNEQVVQPISRVVSRANIVTLQSTSQSTFDGLPDEGNAQGINLISDSLIDVSSSVSVAKHKEAINAKKAELNALKSDLDTQISELKTEVDGDIKDIQDCMDRGEKYYDKDDLRTNIALFEDLARELNANIPNFATALNSYIQALSQQAEIKRRIAQLDTLLQEVSGLEANFDQTYHNVAINLNSEKINLVSQDGDGNIREDDYSCVKIVAPDICLESEKEDSSFGKKSHIGLLANNIVLNTQDSKENGEKNYSLPAVGAIDIVSKKISLECIDAKLEGENYDYKEEKLTEGGSINFRAEKISAQSTDTEGKATGKIELNAKDIEVKGVDVDKETREDTKKAAETTITVFSDKVILGKTDDDNMPTEISLDAKTIKATGKEETLVKQGEKATLDLKGDKLAAKSEGNEIAGELKVKDETTFDKKVTHKADVEGSSASLLMKKVEASFTLKAPNFSNKPGS